MEPKGFLKFLLITQERAALQDIWTNGTTNQKVGGRKKVI